MAKVTTQLADLVEMIYTKIEDFNALTVQKSTELNALYQSGIVITDPAIDALASGDQREFDMPFFNDLPDDEAKTGSDDPDTDSVAAKIDSSRDHALKYFRNNSWSVADLSSVMVAVDPMLAVVNLIEGYWARQDQRLLIASLNGVIASNIANNSSDMIYDVCVDTDTTPTSDNLIGGEAVVMATQTMGDHSQKLVAIAMHSVPYSRLRKLNLVQEVRDPNTGVIQFREYLGLRVIVDDQCPAVLNAATGKIEYTSILFGQGAVAKGNGTPKRPLEYFRNPAGGNGEGIETIHSRKHFILHPRGIAANRTAGVAGASPTNTEIAAAARWTRVYDRKNVRIAFLKTNG